MLAVTVMLLVVAEIEAAVSVTVAVWGPPVLNVALHVAIPLASVQDELVKAVSVEDVTASESLSLVTVWPLASWAVTVMESATPPFAVLLYAESASCATGPRM
jgi:hypothetical protein